MQKIWAIVKKDVYATFSDRSLLLLMFATPLALATIIALAFGDLAGGGGAPIRDIPVAVVNLDEGDSGRIFVDLLVPGAENTSSEGDFMADCGFDADDDMQNGSILQELTDAHLLDDPELARARVDSGRYAAAIIIPADFSARMTFSPTNMEVNPPPVEVYADSTRRAISASVIRSITEGIVNQMLVGQIAVASTYQTLFSQGMAAQSMSLDPCVFVAAFDSGAYTVSITQESIHEDREPINLIVLFGSAQAVFFALFTASGTAANILEERHNGTLQRLVISPTPRSHILFAKLLSTFTNVLLQLILLFIAFTFVSSAIDGEFNAVWGTQWGAIAVTLLVLSLATAGVGMVAAAIAKTAEQANIVGSVVALFMGAAGGAFFQMGELPPLLDAITRLSVVRWGQEAFFELSQNSTDILLNLVALLVIGGALFALSMVLFMRRQDV